MGSDSTAAQYLIGRRDFPRGRDMRRSLLAVLGVGAPLGVVLLYSVCVHITPAVAQQAPLVTQIKPRDAGVAPAAPRLYGAPYVTQVGPTGATLNWVERTSTAAMGWQVRHAPLQGLKAGTTYYYDVFRDGTNEGRGQFTTPTLGDRARFSFIVYGDTRGRDDVHGRIIDKVTQERPLFVVHTGDLVTDGTRADLWPNFFAITAPVMRRCIFFPTLGNHERRAPYFRDFFPELAGYYSFNWGSVHVAVMDSDLKSAADTDEARGAYREKELDWLDRDLAAAASADFRFVIMHHPLFTAMKARQPGAQQLAEWILPILERRHVQAVFAGHDHNYQHHRASGIDFVVTGGGGAPLYDLDAPIPDVTLVTAKTENYVRVRITGRECLIQAVSVDGRTIDTIKIAAPNGRKTN